METRKSLSMLQFIVLNMQAAIIIQPIWAKELICTVNGSNIMPSQTSSAIYSTDFSYDANYEAIDKEILIHRHMIQIYIIQLI